MRPDYDRMCDVKEGNTQAHVERPPLEDALTKVPLASGTDAKTTQDQGMPNEIQAQYMHKHLLEQLN